MPNVIVRRPRTEQPQDAARVNSGFPTLRSLLYPISGGKVVDLVNPSRDMVYAAGIASGVHSKGRYTHNHADGTSTIQATGACNHQKFSRIALVRVNDLPAGSHTISDSRVASGTDGAQWFINGSEFGLNKANAVAMGASTGAGITAGVEFVAGISYDGATVKFFIDGRAIGSAASAQTFILDGVARLFARGDGGIELTNGAIGLHADFEDALPDSVMLSLTDNPWQIFLDEDFPVWFAAGGVILITAADSLTPSFTEVVTLLSRSEISDTLTPSVVETTAVTAGIAVVETLTPSVTEATVITALLTAVDSLTVSLTEAQSSLLSSSVTDILTPSVAETSAIMAGIAAVDTLTPSVTESAVLLIALSAADTLTPSLTETQDSLVFSALSDVLAFTLGEVQGSFVSSNLTEIFSVSVTDTSTMLVGVTATDTFLVSITDAAAVVATAIIEVAASDALSPSFTEVATVVMTDTWGRPTAVVSVWSAGSAITGTWPQDGSISKLWVKDPPVL